MSVISRNALCPCGSNKKYKKCCLLTGQNENPTVGSYAAAERERAKEALLAFSEREHFQKRRRAALEFCFDGLDVLPSRYHDQIHELSLPQQTFLTYLCLDQQLSKDDKTLVVRFMERYGHKLGPGERRFLELLSASSVAVYEIVSIDQERGIELRDMRTDEGISIQVPTTSADLHVFDVIAARLIEGVDGRMVIDGEAYRFTQTQALLLLRFLAERESQSSQEYSIEPKRFMKLFGAALINQFWIQAVLLPGLYETFMKNRMNENEEESPYPYCASFAVNDVASLREALSSERALQDEIYAVTDEVWEWHSTPGAERSSILGELRLIDERLHCEVVSREDAEHLSHLLQGLAGDALRLIAIENIEPDETDIDVEEDGEEESLPALADTHDENWLDTPHHKIDNRTPRELLQDEESRSFAVAILKDFERAAESAGIDRSQIAIAWEKLGLTRE